MGVVLSGSVFFSKGPKKVGTLWREAGLSWKEFLPESQDVGAFIAEQVSDWNWGYSNMRQG